MSAGRERVPALLPALFLIAIATFVAVVVHVVQDAPTPSSLLQQVQSADFYRRLAAADDWMLGPNDRVRLHSKARLQLLAQQSRSRSELSSMQGIIKACSDGNNRACAALAQHRNAVRALQDSQPSTSSSTSSSSFSSSSVPLPGKSSGLSAHDGIWDPRNWQSGDLDSLGGVASDQWLAACGSGDARACRDIARSGTALHNLLLSSSRPGPPLNSYAGAPPPKPVFVARRPAPAPKAQQQGLFSQAMSFLGLGDDFDRQRHPATAVPKMVPDVGLHRGPKYSAVWNDGTVAGGLSDQRGRESVDTDSALRLFDDNVQPRPPEQKFH